jgi:MFS family permease
MSADRNPASVRGVLGIPAYRRIWLAQLISDFGDAVTNLALLLVVYGLTQSTAALALMAIVLVIPQVTIGIVAGAYVDRWDRRRVMLASDLLRGVVVLGFVLVGSRDLLWLLYVLALVQASVGTFFTPARTALVPGIVPAEGLLAANSLSQGGRMLAGVLGTGAAGVLVAAFSVSWPAFVIDAMTFFVSFALILGVRARTVTAAEPPSRSVTEPPSGRPATGQPSVLASVGEGFRIVGRSRRLMGTLVSVAVIMLGLGAVNVLFVPLLINELRVPATWFGAIELAQASSMILSAALLAGFLSRVRPATIVSWTLAGLALAIVLLGGVSAVWQVIALLFAVGWLITPLQAAVTTIVQTETADAARGRVGALLSSVSGSANIVSMAVAGLFGDLLGVRAVFGLAGLLIGLAAVLSVVLLRGRAVAIPAAPVARTA